MKAPLSVGASELNALRERLETHRVALQQLRSRTDRVELLGDGAKKRPLDAKECCGIFMGFLYRISMGLLWVFMVPWDFYWISLWDFFMGSNHQT